MVTLVEWSRVALLKRWHLSKDQKEVKVIKGRHTAMFHPRILRRPSSMPSDWFTTSSEVGGKPTSQYALSYGDHVADLLPG